MFNHAIKYNKNTTKKEKRKENETKKTLYSKDYSDHVALYIFPSLLIY